MGFLVLAALLWLSPAQGGTLSELPPAPNFSLPDLTGKTVSLSEFRGHIVLVDFWATWCLPCRRTLPELSALDKKYHSQGVVVLGLAVDDPTSFDNQYIKAFLQKNSIEYVVLRADQKTIEQYLGKEQPTIPTLFILDKAGRIVKRMEGLPEEKLEAIVEQLLQNP